MRQAMSVTMVVAALAGCGLGDGSVGAAALTGDSGSGGSGADAGSGSGGSAGGSGGSSGNGDNCNTISTQVVDKMDLLFVVDNSGSMREEQAALRAQFPRLIRSLTRGEHYDASGNVIGTFPVVRDLHLGVVSSDMGLLNVPGRAQLGCGDESRPFGDDGVLRNLPNPGGAADVTCAQGYPAFLSALPVNDTMVNDSIVTQVADDFACISALGTAGCGFEMPLESMLRALWPSDNVLPSGTLGSFADGRPFMDESMFGQGAPAGANTGFLRNDIATGQSLIVVVLVTDEDDCSSHNLSHFVPEQFLANGDPLKSVGLNLRCFNEAQRVGGDGPRDQGAANLYATTRYVQALRALRPGREDLVFFAGIVGVPTDLVAPERLDAVDFSNAAARDGYYDSLLADQRLIETEDASTAGGNPNVIPSCLRNITDEQGNLVAQKAFPPRRYLKIAKEMGDNAVITSICNDDFTPAFDQIIQRIAPKLGPVCLPRVLDVNADGATSCEVIWELPLPGMASGDTPTACAQRPDLLESPPAGSPQVGKNGGALCVVSQVPVIDGKPNTDPAAGNINGWYYDDFSAALANCDGADKQRVAFTIAGAEAPPPLGVTVRLVCPGDVLPTACR